MRETNPIWPGRDPAPEAKRAKRTQFRPAERTAEAKCAKRTQFGPAGRRDECEGSSVKLEKVWCQAIRLPTSHFSEERLTASLRTGRNVQNEPNLVSLGSSTGRRMRKTNPILPQRRRLTEESMQNEAKLGGTGVYGQRQSCGVWLGPGVKRAKRTQFGPAGG
jgi:hypothetical protein